MREEGIQGFCDKKKSGAFGEFGISNVPVIEGRDVAFKWSNKFHDGFQIGMTKEEEGATISMDEIKTFNDTQGSMLVNQSNDKVVMNVRDITKSLPLGREKIEILKGISFQIMSGEFVSIVGPSGSGKSTLLGIIAGLDNPTSGQVFIDRLGHRPNQLSGGEQQRVAIARSLATDPAFVIADEPTGNLDAKNGENVLNLIAYLREQTGKTFIIATHDPVVASHADRSIRLVDGLIAGIDIIGGKIAQ